MTMATGSTIVPAPGGPGDDSREMGWIPTPPPEQTADRRPNGRSGAVPDVALLVRTTAQARTALLEAAAAAVAAADRARSLAEQLNEALAALTQVETAPELALAPTDVSPHGTDALSPREREVLTLVAAGRSNKAIAEALYISPNTVKTHVASLLHKLQVDTRVQLAAIATRRGLHRRAAIGAEEARDRRLRLVR